MIIYEIYRKFVLRNNSYKLKIINNENFKMLFNENKFGNLKIYASTFGIDSNS